MQYDLTSDFQRKAFLSRVDNLLEKGSLVELTEKAVRTKGQNNYLHLLLGVVAMETGNTLADVKEYYFKEICNSDLFHRQHFDKLGNCIDSVRSSADLTKEEMSVAIDRFKRWASGEGIYIPEMGDDELLKQVYIDMGRMSAYIGG
jgi:hypothetical protein